MKRLSALALAADAAGAGMLGGHGGGDRDKDGAKTISSHLKPAAQIEFGQVQTQEVADAADLRKKLTAGNA